MRIAWIILLMAAIGGALVQLRAGQNAARAETHRLRAEWWQSRRRLWDQQLRLNVRRLAPPAGEPDEPAAVELVGPGEPGTDRLVVRRD